MVAGPSEAANVEVLAGVTNPLRRSRWRRPVLGLLMNRGSCVYRFGAEVIEIWLRLVLWVLLPRGPAEKVVISWSLDHWGLDSSFTA